MSGSTSVPAPYIGPAGFVAPAESDILDAVLADLNAAFGGNLNIENLETPQGQLASTITAIIANKNTQFLQLVAACDPAYAQGRNQDALARIYFIERIPAQGTIIQVVCIGASGVAINAYSTLSDTSGNQYIYLGSTVQFDSTGTLTLPFQNTQPGPIAVPAPNAISLNSTTFGWDTVSCLGGVLGVNVESRADFELRRQLSVAKNATGTLAAVQAAVLAVPNVLDCYVTENFTAAAVTVGGVSIPKNSLYVCAYSLAQAGTAATAQSTAVGTAIWSKKPPGCGYAGDTTVTVTDNSYPVPYPTYQVTFQSPTLTPIYFQVNLFASTLIPSDAGVQINAAITAAFAGTDGGPRPRIGSRISAGRFYAAVANLGTWAQIDRILVDTASPAAQDYVQMAINQVPTLIAGNITVGTV